MLDIKNLERRWLKYKIKSYFPFLGIIIVTILAISGSLFWLNKTEPVPVQEINQSSNISSKSITNIQQVVPTESNDTTYIEPSMDFVQSFQNTQAVHETTPVQVPKNQKTVLQKPISNLPQPTILNMPELPQTSSTPGNKVTMKEPSQTLTINRNESKLDIDELQRRFKDTSNANLGLFISRYYYDHGNYNEAYNYALKTNAINNKIDESWLLFSKSLVKLGKSDQAKKTLQIYISQSGSETAKELLNSIEKGDFK